MNLLELAGKEVKAWPSFAGWLVQSVETGEIIFDEDPACGESANFKATVIADDADNAVVTRSEWMTELARIEEATKYERKQRPKYEQSLWDKAYFEAWTIGMKEYASNGTLETMEILTTGSAALADAFMAERAKRLKGVK